MKRAIFVIGLFPFLLLIHATYLFGLQEDYVVYTTANRTVIKLAPNGTELMRLPKGVWPGMPQDFRGVAVNPKDGTIWVYSHDYRLVYHLDANLDGYEDVLNWFNVGLQYIMELEVDPSDGSI